MSAHAALARAERNGLRLRLLPDGRVRVEADAPPPPALLAELRQYRDEVAALLAEREGRPARKATPTAAPSPPEAEAVPLPAPDPVEVGAQAREMLRFASETAGEAMAPPEPAEAAPALDPAGVAELTSYAAAAAAELRAARMDEDVAALAAELAEAAQTVAEVLRSAPPAEDAEAMREYYASEPTADPYQPGDRDPLRAGLAAAARGRGSFPAAGRMREAEARRIASVRPEFRGYTPARRHIPPEERLEGRTGPAAGSEFRRG